MNNWKLLARRALRGALETRHRANVSKFVPICVYDLAERLGVEVRFHGGNTFGGMYAKASQTILVPSLRPHGRRAFTCGHELGHWYFGHGDRIDGFEAIGYDNSGDPEEQIVNIYSGHLLMPRWAVQDAFDQRKLNPNTSTPLQIYTIACQLGVGYQTLIQHALRSLELLSPTHATNLLKTIPKEIRESAVNEQSLGHLVITDEVWKNMPVDLQVGDRAILPMGVTLQGKSAVSVATCKLGLIIEGRVPGITRAELKPSAWAAFIRVSKKDFEGRSIYRHMEDPDVE